MLRFLAALFVCLFHFNEGIYYVDNDYRNFVKLGWIGVPIFFVISGYCIQMAAREDSPTYFLIRRFFRIYPMYWFSLLLVAAIAIFQKVCTGSNSVHNLPHKFEEVVSTIFLNIDPVNKIASVNWVYWSLVCEILFYVLFTISLIFKTKTRELFLAALCILSLILSPEKGNLLYIFKHWPSFALGIGIFLIFHKKDKIKEASMISILAFLGVLKQNFFEPDGYVYFIGILLTATLIIVSEWKDLPTNKFSNLGKYAYSIYLLHVPIGVFLLSSIINFNKTEEGKNIFIDLSTYLLVSLISAYTYKYVELPAISLGKKIGKKFKS